MKLFPKTLPSTINIRRVLQIGVIITAVPKLCSHSEINYQIHSIMMELLNTAPDCVLVVTFVNVC